MSNPEAFSSEAVRVEEVKRLEAALMKIDTVLDRTVLLQHPTHENVRARLAESSPAELCRLVDPYISEVKEGQPLAAARLYLLRSCLAEKILQRS